MKGAKRMENGAFAAYLQHFGLSRQEALVYQNLLLYGKRTGYEIAKETGISRSNVYGALSVLAEKGAAYVLEESAKKYIPVKLEEFCGNWIRKLKEEEQWMRENLPDIKEAEEGYITIEGDANIRDKLHNLECGGACLYFRYGGAYPRICRRFGTSCGKEAESCDHHR